MQCFQKDPNLRVSARKLQKHAWIVGCRRSDAPVSKPEAVEEVVRWNRALESSESHLRGSIGSDNSGPPLQPGLPRYPGSSSDPHRSNMVTPAKGPLALAKPRPSAEAFSSPELAGKGFAREILLQKKNFDGADSF